jgi:protease secretion system membrane fusion protein
VKGNRRLLQHPAGGVVEQIHVREGDTVRQGDMLLKINQLSTDAALNSTELEYINAMAVESRLLSEQDNRQEVSWLPEIVKAADDPRVEEAKRQQARLFLSRKTEINGQLRILRERLYGLRSQASELSRVISARSQQLKNMGSEVAKNTELAAKGFVSRTRVSEVERLQSEVIASLATARADLGKARSEIASTQLEIDQHLAVYRREVDAELGETKKQRGALRSKVESLKFDRSLTELRAPVTGTVVALKVHTIGGVIQPGEVLLEVVPNEGMIVEARVPPRLIDKVKSGLEADMRFTAFNANTTPVVPGTVKMVGADRLVENSKDKPDEYYLIQIEADEGIKHLKGQRVQPGMPVDVVIKTGERTFVSYLFKPITDRLATSFKD